MTIDEQSAIAKYIGCKCEIYSLITGYTWEICKLDVKVFLYSISEGLSSFRVLLTPVENLTQEDFERMQLEVWNDPDYNKMDAWYLVIDDEGLQYQEADWLRRNGYYLNEELIKGFVKLK